jgi:hypothetical protein
MASYAATPVQVPGLPSPCTAVAAGEFFNLVVDHHGRVWTWGVNGHGELGQGFTSIGQSQAARVHRMARMVAVAAGNSHALVLDRTGAVRGWGGNNVGQVGDGTAVDRTSPVPVQGLPGAIKAISAGMFSSMALASDGSVWVWGGLRPGGVSPALPIQAAGLTGVIAIAAGDVGLVAKDDGTVWTLDTQGPSNPLNLNQVAGIVGARAVATRGGHFLALCRGRFEFVPRQVDFGRWRVGSTSDPVTIALSNTGSVPIDLWSPPFHGNQYIGPGDGFSLTGNPPATLAPGATTDFTARFKPTARGNYASSPLFVFDCGLDRLELSGEGA